MTDQKIDWDDLRYVLRVAQQGSIAAAAKSLQVNRTTVLRRVNQFEKQLDYQLFDRHGAGYALAPGAESLLSAAIEVEKSIDNLHRQILGKAVQLQGELCVTTTDSILKGYVAPHIASFRTRHPQITVELVVSNHRLNLSRREADVALRPGSGVPDNLIGRKIGTLEFGIYASASYLQQHPDLPIEAHRWLGGYHPISQSPPGQWVQNNIPEQQICLKADSFMALQIAAENHMGLAVLPSQLGAGSNSLQRVFENVEMPQSTLWVMTHPDLARSARIHAFIEHICEQMGEH